MYCKHCGKQIDKDSKFCTFCGSVINFIPAYNEQTAINTSNINPQSVNINLSFGKNNEQQQEKQGDKNILSEIKYDPYFIQDESLFVIGVLSLLAFIVINIFFAFSKNQYQEFFIPANLVIFIWRVLAIFWSTIITKSLNRNPNWGWLAFFFPGITLIILGKKKKLLFPSDYNKWNRKDQSAFNNYLANLFQNHKDYNSAISFADKAINLDSENHYAYDTRGHIKYYLQDYSGALNDFNKSILMNSNIGNGIKYNHRGYAKKEIGDLKGAFEDWKISLSKGYLNAQEPIDKYCTELKYTDNIT